MLSPATRNIEVHKIAGALGAEISGVDLARELDDATVAEIRRIWLDNCVVFFRNCEVLRPP
jgi:taurine dioxygenase